MAYGLVHFYPGGTKEQYEAALAGVHPDRKTLPKGQLYHAAGPSAGGWTVIAIWDSKAGWERFRDDILMPRFRQGGALPRHHRNRRSRCTTCNRRPSQSGADRANNLGARSLRVYARGTGSPRDSLKRNLPIPRGYLVTGRREMRNHPPLVRFVQNRTASPQGTSRRIVHGNGTK